jgi:hypothetical protein
MKSSLCLENANLTKVDNNLSEVDDNISEDNFKDDNNFSEDNFKDDLKDDNNLSQSSESSCAADEKANKTENKSSSSLQIAQIIVNTIFSQTQFINTKYLEIIC